MTSQVQIFLLPADEQEFSAALLKGRPTLRFIDDNVWLSPSPPLVADISACKSPRCYLWESALFPQMPCLERRDGRFEGPISGVVVQVDRSRVLDSSLLSGRVAVGFDNPTAEVKRFAKFVFDTLKRITKPVTSPATERQIAAFRAGPAASAWASLDGNAIRDRATKQLFLSSTS